ncbi:MAG: c-type cytochrome [Proteobacteria bacterium]|nr:c-type cytochrome [Pseudomonadota bacterium]
MKAEHMTVSIHQATLARLRGRASLLALTAALVAPAASAAETTASGEQVYKQVCMSCHAAGVANAPKFGDRTAWTPLIKEGQEVLTAHAWVGVRAMPPKGGQADLPLDAFARATAYIARAAGGNWKDPDAAMLGRIRAEEFKRIAQMKATK